jgi:aminoglycoside phosphotransferase (APT) family kinase protein
MTELVDESSAIRKGEELDTGKLEAALRSKVPGLDGALELEQFRKGHSNLTYLLRCGDQEMVLRRAPFGSKVKGAHDMGREFKVLSKLQGYYGPAPKPIAYFEDPEIIGTPFYVMQRIRGAIFRIDCPEGLTISPELARKISLSFIQNLADLHMLDFRAAGLDELQKPGSYMERQVNGWADRYHGSQTDEISAIDEAITWLKKDIPADCGAALVHNDYKYDNIILDANDLTKIIGVLDWEMSTIGDPLADLATALSYWTNPGEDDPLSVARCFLTRAPGSMTRLELANRYAEITGRNVDNILYYYVLGTFKLAVIVQQIYYRYAKGLTQDERFAVMIEVVKLMGQRAVQTISSGRM